MRTSRRGSPPGWAGRRRSSSTAIFLNGAQPIDEFKKVIDVELASEVSEARERIAWAADVPLDEALRSVAAAVAARWAW